MAATARPLEIGLVNNMPDAALAATERQFRALVASAAGERPWRLRLYHMPQIARGEAARRHLGRQSAEIDALPCEGLDALIVTGSEPKAADMRDEAHWTRLAELVDWAERHTASTLWSCLAAHAAVLHRDGLVRRPLARKLSGVFAVDAAAAHPLLAGVPAGLQTPHSRWNTLPEEALAAAGYTVMTRSDAVGADAFVAEGASRFVFLQGHPEYDGDALRLEYRRDVRRYLDGEAQRAPDAPRGVFPPATEAALSELSSRRAQLSDYAPWLTERRQSARWRPGWTAIFRNWIDGLAPQQPRAPCASRDMQSRLAR